MLDGRVAIVTGASRGIGAAGARALGAAGASVVLAARDSAALAQVAAEISQAGGQAHPVPTDVSDADSVRRLVDAAVDTYGRLDVAVNNAAGGGHWPTPLADVAVADFDSGIAVSLRSVFLSMKYEIPAMVAAGGGSIINMSSTAGLRPVAGMTAYVASKFGVIGLSRTAALDYATAGIRVNALAPGPILTEQFAQAGPEVEAQAARAIPVGRMGTPAEVARAVVWLASDESAFVTGTTLTVDGGLLAGQPTFGP